VGGCAPRARGGSVRPRLKLGASGRPLNFTVSRHGISCVQDIAATQRGQWQT